MKLNYKQFGSGQPLVILHGLFGSLDNWQTLAKQFAQSFNVYIIDQRNHGQSPHSDEWNYQVMADDLFEFFEDHQIKNAILLGHSMGGKTAMQFAIQHGELLDKLIIADIAPKAYLPHHQKILESLQSIDFNKITSRQEVEEKLSQNIPDIGTRQFLLKNLYWKEVENKKLAWRFNIEAIARNIEIVNEGISDDTTCDVPTLFIRGSKSDYILDSDIELISSIFCNVKLETIDNVGHWLHAEAPQKFMEIILRFAEE